MEDSLYCRQITKGLRVLSLNDVFPVHQSLHKDKHREEVCRLKVRGRNEITRKQGTEYENNEIRND